ncbi:hypothetical protein Tco_0371416, partial [Tanacetum coccineum]
IISITKEQQQALDDALVLQEQCLRIASFHKHCIEFKLNNKRYSFDVETFRDMLPICPNLPGQKFVDPPFKEEILAFMRELGYPGNIKSLSDVKVEILPQP